MCFVSSSVAQWTHHQGSDGKTIIHRRASLMVVGWAQRRSLPRQDKIPAEGRSSHFDLLMRMALAILIIGFASMVVGVALVAQNM